MNKELREERFDAKLSKINMFLYEIGRIINKNTLGHIKRKRGMKTTTRQNIFVWVMLAIPILNFLVFWLYVNIGSIMMAFQNVDYAEGGKVYWTIDNFKTVYKLFSQGGAELAHYGMNTLKYWGVSLIMGLPYSILLTYLLHKKVAGHKFFRVALYLPALICGVVIAGIFESFISPNGAFGYILKTVFDVARVPSWFQETEFATGMLIFYTVFFGMAGNYVLMSGAMAKIPTEVTEAALMDGVTMWQELWYIDIPMMWPTISMIIVTSFSGIFSASGPILLFTPNLSDTWTWGYWIFDQVRTFNSYYVPSALGLIFTVIALPVMIVLRRVVTNMFTEE